MCRATDHPRGPHRCERNRPGDAERQRRRYAVLTQEREWSRTATDEDIRSRIAELEPQPRTVSVRRVLERELERRTAVTDTEKASQRKPSPRSVAKARRDLEAAERRLRMVSMGTASDATVAVAQEKRDAAAARLAALTGDAEPETTAKDADTQKSAPPIRTREEAEQEVAAIMENLRASGKTDMEIAEMMREALSEPGRESPTKEAIREQMKALIRAEGARRKAEEADQSPVAAKDKEPEKPERKKASTAPPTMTDAEFVAHVDRLRAADEKRRAEWNALADSEKSERIKAHFEQIARRDEEARRRSAERRAARLAAMTDAERQAFLEQEAEDERRWQEVLTAQRARAAEQPRDGWDEDADEDTEPDFRQIAALRNIDELLKVQREGGDVLDRLRYLEHDERRRWEERQARFEQVRQEGDAVQHAAAQIAVQSHSVPVQQTPQPNPWLSLREQQAQIAARRDTAIRAERAAEQPLSTPELRAAAEQFDSERLEEGAEIIERIRVERLVADAEERRRAEVYAQSEEGQHNPFAVAFAKRRRRRDPQTLAIARADVPVPKSGHKIPRSAGLPFGGRIAGKLDLRVHRPQVAEQNQQEGEG